MLPEETIKQDIENQTNKKTDENVNSCKKHCINCFYLIDRKTNGCEYCPGYFFIGVTTLVAIILFIAIILHMLDILDIFTDT